MRASCSLYPGLLQTSRRWAFTERSADFTKRSVRPVATPALCLFQLVTAPGRLLLTILSPWRRETLATLFHLVTFASS